jgi:DNA repair ATPase RecN
MTVFEFGLLLLVWTAWVAFILYYLQEKIDHLRHMKELYEARILASQGLSALIDGQIDQLKMKSEEFKIAHAQLEKHWGESQGKNVN